MGLMLQKVQKENKSLFIMGDFNINNKKRSHTQLDSRKQVIAFQDRVITINIKEAQHPLNNKKRSHTQLDSRKQVIAFQDRVITL